MKRYFIAKTREKLRLTRKFYLTQKTQKTQKLFFEHGCHGSYGWRILLLQYLFCDFRDFCVTLSYYCAQQYRFSHLFAFSRIFAIPSHRANEKIFNREKARKIQTYAKTLSHTENTENTEIIFRTRMSRILRMEDIASSNIEGYRLVLRSVLTIPPPTGGVKRGSHIPLQRE